MNNVEGIIAPTPLPACFKRFEFFYHCYIENRITLLKGGSESRKYLVFVVVIQVDTIQVYVLKF